MQKVSYSKNRFLFYIAGLFLIVSAASCARKIVFQTSDVVPAAVGKVKIKKDQNNNYAVDVEVKNLADPSRLTPSKKYYIVWIETQRDGIQKLGRIKSSSGLFSDKLKASLETVTTMQPQRVFITGEDNVDTSYPGNQVVLTTGSF